MEPPAEAREPTVTLNTIGALIDYRMSLRVHCAAWGCLHSALVDLEALAARLGRSHSCMAPNFKRYFRCAVCGSREVGFILSPYFDESAIGRGGSPMPAGSQAGRPNTTHGRRRKWKPLA